MRRIGDYMIERPILMQMLEDARGIAFQQEDTLRKMQAVFLVDPDIVYDEPELESNLKRAIAAASEANEAITKYSNKLSLMWEARKDDMN